MALMFVLAILAGWRALRFDWYSFGLSVGLALAALLTMTVCALLWRDTSEFVPGAWRTSLPSA